MAELSDAVTGTPVYDELVARAWMALIDPSRRMSIAQSGRDTEGNRDGRRDE
ncbi:hypothetical protein G6553_01530 [Nocardioides sp. IC4_145]|uniref:hypothetical protein n=1 Tax=Nocardioides sp. IC4_145 TaxID=2714037 RepID=UPI0014080FF5|nr:hypothetical protein [Nocardioides sp. IC4_145]NHC21855.1 hypothetical protein [Nocardioides sp. IC4_145]